jgi:hypothetical protein
MAVLLKLFQSTACSLRCISFYLSARNAFSDAFAADNFLILKLIYCTYIYNFSVQTNTVYNMERKHVGGMLNSGFSPVLFVVLPECLYKELNFVFHNLEGKCKGIKVAIVYEEKWR